MAPPNIRPLTIPEIDALKSRVYDGEGYINVLSEIEYHSNEFVQPRAQEYIRRIREYFDREIAVNGFVQPPEDLIRIRNALRRLLETKKMWDLYGDRVLMEGLDPVDAILPPVLRVPPPPRHGGRRRKHKKTRSRSRIQRRKTRSRR